MTAVCGGCGSPVGEKAKFCAECGTKVPGESTDDVRKTVTALFCDIVGSTSLGEHTDPESFRALLERYFTVMRSDYGHPIGRARQSSFASYPSAHGAMGRDRRRRNGLATRIIALMGSSPVMIQRASLRPSMVATSPPRSAPSGIVP